MSAYKSLLNILFFGIFLGTTFSNVSGQEVMWESEILKKILLNNSDYVREARPANDSDETVNITVVPRFLRIENINEVENSFTATIILIQVWKDRRLTWNPQDYGGVKYVYVPSDRLWLPDIIPYNTVSQTSQDPLYEETAGVSNSGYIEWGPMITIAAECPMDVTNFPFDTQTCTIQFGSWLHTKKQISLNFARTTDTEKDILLTDTNLPFSPHAFWHIIGDKVAGKIEDIRYGNSEISVLSLTAHVQRKASFYKYLAIGPGALLGLLVPVLFLLPPRSQEKNTFGILIILGLILLVSVLATSTPINHSNTPRMGVFYLITMVLIIISLFLSIVISNISFRGLSRSPMPQWMQTLFLQDGVLRKVLCMSSPMKSIYGNFQSPEDLPKANSASETQMVDVPKSSSSEVTTYLRFICEKLTADDAYRNVSQDWAEVARVLDRILFLIFLVVYIITALALLT